MTQAWRIADIEPAAPSGAPNQWHMARALTRLVADSFGVPGPELLGMGRTRTVAQARLVLYYLCRHVPTPTWSYPEIARACWRRDHTTILSGIDSLERKMKEDSDLWLRVVSLTTEAKSLCAG